MSNLIFYKDVIIGFLAGLISVLLLSLLRKERTHLNYLLVCLPYIMVTLPFLASRDLPGWDSWFFHFRAFRYVADAIAHGHVFPEWFQTGGGIRIGFYHVNLFPFLPHRIIGYLLYSILPISIVIAYKLQYILGVILMCFGWWLVLMELTHCRYASFFGALMIMMGGTGITFHQEQALATTYLMPWFVLSLLKLRDNASYVLPTVVLFGLGLSTHYPQIQLISMGLVFLFMIISYPHLIKKAIPKRKWLIPVLLLLFILAILPSFYIYINIDNLASPLRGKENICQRTYDEYIHFVRKDHSYASPKYYMQYIKPIFKRPRGFDRCSFFVGRIALILALFWILTQFRRSVLIILLLAIFTLLTLGVDSIVPIPRYLYLIRFPFIEVFRQWFHFFPMVNFCLSAMAALGFASLIRYLRPRSALLFSASLAFVLFFQIADLAIYDMKYINAYRVTGESIEKFDIPDRFSSKAVTYLTLFQYKNRFKLSRFCPHAIPTESFLTTNIVGVLGGPHREFQRVCKMALKKDAPIVINSPLPALSRIYSPGKEIISKKCAAKIQYNKLLFNVMAPQPALVATPLNYDLGPKAYVDGREVKVYRVNSALSGILVKKGDREVTLSIPSDLYLPTVIINILLHIFLALFFIVAMRKESRSY